MKILIIKNEGQPVRQLKDEHIEKIKETGPDSEVVATWDAEEIVEHLANAEVLACSPRNFPSIENAKNLKWIHAFSADFDEGSKEFGYNFKQLVWDSCNSHSRAHYRLYAYFHARIFQYFQKSAEKSMAEKRTHDRVAR